MPRTAARGSPSPSPSPSPPPVTRALDDSGLLERVLAGVGAREPRRAAGLLLERFGHLPALGRAAAPELCADRALGDDAARTLAAVFELGRRCLAGTWPDDAPFTDPEEVWAHYRASLGSLDREVFVVVGLDARCRRRCEVRVAEGGLSSCVVEPRDVFLPLLRAAAQSAVLVHNHPSGDPTPSAADRRLTARLVSAGRLLGIQVLDHVVVALSGYSSLAEEGTL